MTILRGPSIEYRPARHYLGIRASPPMRGMSCIVTGLFKELPGWFSNQGLEPDGPPFLRYHVIDMEGSMQIEACLPVRSAIAGDERVRPGILPAGRYASLVFTGSGYAGNKALIEWARANSLLWDRWDDPAGDAFRARYETYLTDTKVEPRKTRWQVEVAIKLAEE